MLRVRRRQRRVGRHGSRRWSVRGLDENRNTTSDGGREIKVRRATNNAEGSCASSGGGRGGRECEGCGCERLASCHWCPSVGTDSDAFGPRGWPVSINEAKGERRAPRAASLHATVRDASYSVARSKIRTRGRKLRSRSVSDCRADDYNSDCRPRGSEPKIPRSH